MPSDNDERNDESEEEGEEGMRAVEQALSLLEDDDLDQEELEDELEALGFESHERPPAHKRRIENPPTVPLHGDRELVWMEWDPLPDGDVAHWQFHWAEPGSNETSTLMPAILTREARALDLGSTPCPQCFPEHEGNDHLVTMTDTETGTTTTVDPEELTRMETDLEEE